ncbi:hypothetical protein AALO_G00143730 [Alosa alosa]|uniref:Secreted protein n=1 Tax=Alosa alosa TaxID=278164 RepID=A0AAV6GMA7_9TELE|nr:hypothetical protein AALO_G00143730 [Alosa alosa]
MCLCMYVFCMCSDASVCVYVCVCVCVCVCMFVCVCTHMFARACMSSFSLACYYLKDKFRLFFRQGSPGVFLAVLPRHAGQAVICLWRQKNVFHKDTFNDPICV